MKIMKKVCLLLFITAFIMPNTICASGDLPAFPGAEGFGSATPGGRGGRVIKVTNLNSGGPGSLADAVAQEGPRIVVFDVSGVIHGDIKIVHPYITIAGQTAPGGGITIDGILMKKWGSDAHDIVIRFLRVRPTNAQGASGDSIQIASGYNVILDHLSLSWSCDETIDMCGTNSATVQWCTIEESSLEGHPKGPHNLGMILGYGSHSITIHHNLFAHHSRRNPFGFATPLDLRNNVIYNHQDGSALGLRDNELKIEGLKEINGYKRINVVGNYYKAGPDSSPRQGFPYAFGFYGDCKYYFKNNNVSNVVFDNPIRAAQNGVPHIGYGIAGVSEDILLKEPAPVPPVTTYPVQEAYRMVLTNAGCFPRDVVTKRTVQEVITGTGSWGKHIPADLIEGLTPVAPPQDSDNDGMPDEWEAARGLNPAERSDCRKVMSSGYTAIEEYINERADYLIKNYATLDIPAPQVKKINSGPLSFSPNRATNNFIDDIKENIKKLAKKLRKR